MGQVKPFVLVLTVFSLAAFSPAAQQDKRAIPNRNQSPETPSGRGARPAASTSTSKEKQTLADVTRVSTAEAAHKAAKDLAKDGGSATPSEASGASDVMEFHPSGPDAPGAAVVVPRESRKSALKNVHGDAYGAVDGSRAGKQAGGSVGATSKSGKTSIYVQTDRSHETTPAPR